MHIDVRQFSNQSGDSRELFKACVECVHIEISSYCNRSCSFCTNVLTDRRTVQKYMSDALFDKLTSELASIDYSQKVRFHRYNEPFADAEYCLKRIAQLKAKVPNCNLEIISNGDYLKHDIVLRAAEAGCNAIDIDLYLPEETVHTVPVVLQHIDRRLKQLRFPYTIVGGIDEFVMATVDTGTTMQVRMLCRDLAKIGNGRLGLVGSNKDFKRTEPCESVFTTLEIEPDGTVLPCCNFRSDIAAQKRYIVTNVSDEDTTIFKAYADSAMVGWRRSLLHFGSKPYPCNICYDRVIPASQENIAAFNGAALALGLISREEAEGSSRRIA